jgi:hypothetical protein
LPVEHRHSELGRLAASPFLRNSLSAMAQVAMAASEIERFFICSSYLLPLTEN